VRSQLPCLCLSQVVCMPSVSTTVAFGRLPHAPLLSFANQTSTGGRILTGRRTPCPQVDRNVERRSCSRGHGRHLAIASIALARRWRPALLQAGSGASQIDLMEARDRRASVTSNLRSPEPATATVSEATVCKTSVELPIWSPAAGACSAPSASRTLAAAKYRSRESGVLVYLSA
jgi:hypothetical protein